MSRLKITLVAVFSLAVFILAACGSEPAVPEVIIPTVPAIEVNITSDVCPSVEISPSMQVIWINKDDVEHIVRVNWPDSDEILIDLGVLKPGDSGSFTFIESGTYSYWCTQDLATQGTITVQP